MVRRGEGKLVVWPHYFDKSLTRAQGRRVPLELAVEDPRANDLAQAARTLGYKVELEEEARAPSTWYHMRGRIVLERKGEKKEAVLQALARRL